MVDVFYFTDALGGKVMNASRLKRIEKRLLLALEPVSEREDTKTKPKKVAEKKPGPKKTSAKKPATSKSASSKTAGSKTADTKKAKA